jgi:hypothetical protein
MAACIRSNAIEGSLGGAVVTGKRCQLLLKKALDIGPDEH